MSLPDSYLQYPTRKHGNDHTLYKWRTIRNRPKKHLSKNHALAVGIVVPLEHFMLNPSGRPFKHPGAMVTPYPDLRHYTTRDYGNRIGAFRLLKAFQKHSTKVTFAINAALLERVKPLIDAIISDGHEIAAHGWDTDSIHWGEIEPAQEKAYILKTREAFSKARLEPRTWLSPARQQSFNTPELIKDAGFDICLDWEIDSVPLAMNTNAGPLYALPLSNELDDRLLLQTKHHSEAEWVAQIIEAATMMRKEAARIGAQSLNFTMTPYIAGLPFRIWAVEDVLAALNNDNTIKLATSSDIVDSFK